MAVATFDTLKFANTLKAAGVPAQQAEAQAVAFAEVIQLNFKDLANKDDMALLKTDIALLKTELKGDLEHLRTDLRQEVSFVKQELSAKMDISLAKVTGEIYLLRWMFGATFTAVVAVLWLIIRLSFVKSP
jgi:hypothetical protein